MTKKMFIRQHGKKTIRELADMGFKPVSVFINDDNQLLFILPEDLKTDEIIPETSFTGIGISTGVDNSYFDILAPYNK